MYDTSLNRNGKFRADNEFENQCLSEIIE